MVKGKPGQKPRSTATRTRRRFNRFSLGRAAVLYKRGMPRHLVLEHYFRTYAKKWGIRDYFEMYRYLFEKRPGPSPNLAELFEGKSEDQIRDAFIVWRQRSLKFSNHASKQLKKLYEEAKKDPERAKRFGDASRANLEIARAKHESLRETNPEYRESVRDKARVTIVNARAKAKRLRKTDPKYVERISDRTKALWKDSEWRANQTELIRSGLQRYWSLVRKGLLTEFRGRGLIKSTDNRAEKGEKLIAGTTKTPQSEAIERERKEQVEIAIQRLKPEEAEAITSTFFEGNDLSTTAENMGITLTQLNKILDNAYRKLVKELRNI